MLKNDKNVLESLLLWFLKAIELKTNVNIHISFLFGSKLIKISSTFIGRNIMKSVSLHEFFFEKK